VLQKIVSALCFNYGCFGHYAWQCRKPKRGKAPRVPTSMIIQLRGQPRAPTPRSGRVNHTTIKDIPEGEEVLMGTFLLFRRPIIISFDSGASHGFMSSAYTERVELSLTVAKPSYMIHTPGGRIVANQITKEVPLELAGQVFSHSPHYLGWTRDRCHFGNELDEATPSYFGYS
jgi:hypothetical protein